MQFQDSGINGLYTGNQRVFVNTNLNSDSYYTIDIKDIASDNFVAAIIKSKGVDYFPIDPNAFAGGSFNIFASNLPGFTTELHYVLGTAIEPDGLIQFDAIVGVPAQVNETKVAGVVQIDGVPAKRTVRAFTYDSETMTLLNRDVTAPRPLGETTSDPDTGAYELVIASGYTGRIFVVAFDEYGSDFTGSMAVAVGDKVHPTTANGFVYECTSGGTLPSDEPAWSTDTKASQIYGTASMIAIPFYRPMVHGPVTPEIIDQDPDPEP